jgi:DNA-binding IclR family transcriptional regulator
LDKAGRPGGSEPRSGTQAVERAFDVLRAIAAHGDEGARLSDLVGQLGLSKPTVRRLVAALVGLNIAAQDPRTRRYNLGLELFSLGALAGRRLDLRLTAAGALATLADETQDTVFLSIPDGANSVCIARYEGQFPIKALTMSVGDRRPLGIGAGSLAMLSCLRDDEISAVLAANAGRYQPFASEVSPEILTRRIAETRQHGFASSAFFFDSGIAIPGMNAIGVPILTAYGIVLGAVSVAAVPERLQPPRRDKVVALAKVAARDIAATAMKK